MIVKFLTILLFAYYVSAVSTFIGDSKKRAELFELTDDEVAVFRIQIPDDEFVQLKEEAQSYGSSSTNGGGNMPQGDNGNHGDHEDFGGDHGGDHGGDREFNRTESGMQEMQGMPDQQFQGFNITEGEMRNGENMPNGDMQGFNKTMDGFPGDNNGSTSSSSDDDSFKTKNATMIVELNGTEKSFKKVTFSIGGSSSRSFGKQSYNLKIRGKDELYGRTQFRLRPDAREATFLRSKLACDIHNRLGVLSISANYATLYINDEYMGFYVLMDAIKLSWIEYEYNEEDSTTLYQCKDMNNDLTVQNSANGCSNENDDVTDNSEWVEFLTALDNAQSPEDIEDILDIDQFLTEIAFEYLSGSWDHYLNFGHNFYMYKPKDDKWKFLLYDFDGEFGQDVSNAVRGSPGQNNNKNGSNKDSSTNTSTDYPSYSFEDWTKSRHLIDILILNNSTRFDNILRNFVTEVFNPATLYPHIDELKEFIRPYVELDKIPDENGKYPGRINESADDYSLAEWDANCEFTSVKSSQNNVSYGLKYWILAKYRYVCEAYNIECDSTYLDENYEYPIDKDVEASYDDDSINTKSTSPYTNEDDDAYTKSTSSNTNEDDDTNGAPHLISFSLTFFVIQFVLILLYL